MNDLYLSGLTLASLGMAVWLNESHWYWIAAYYAVLTFVGLFV
ncbi:hypothetical protein V2P20_03570 [Methylobacter sp. Wu1]